MYCTNRKKKRKYSITLFPRKNMLGHETGSYIYLVILLIWEMKLCSPQVAHVEEKKYSLFKNASESHSLILCTFGKMGSFKKVSYCPSSDILSKSLCINVWRHDPCHVQSTSHNAHPQCYIQGKAIYKWCWVLQVLRNSRRDKQDDKKSNLMIHYVY